MNLLNLFGFGNEVDPAYARWLQQQGRGGGVPQREAFGTFDPSLSYDVQQDFDTAGYDKAMQQYDWQKRFADMQNQRFYAQLANAFAPRYPDQPRAPGALGPASRAFAPIPAMRNWA